MSDLVSTTEFEDGIIHRPVLYQEILNALQPKQGGFYLDGTLGAGGHSSGILEACEPDGQLIGLDVDPHAIELARRRLVSFGNRVHIFHDSYTNSDEVIASLGWKSLDGALLDLGVSSLQLDEGGRGFSFQADAPLDMRFDPTSSITAAHLVNTLSEVELASIIFRYGEERYARQIASAIVKFRPLRTTKELTQIVERVIPQGYSRRGAFANKQIHPATLTFQAIRIAVNGELEALETALPRITATLSPGGRLAVISFHSLEDRLVKQFFRRESRDCLCPPRQPVCTCGHKASLVDLTHHPIRPQPDEIARNPRSRSAKLRIAEKITE